MTDMILKIKNADVLIDADDYNVVCGYNWYNACGYAVAYCPETKKHIKMHRLINNTPSGLDTDHINLNTLDNRKSNLRSVTRSENCQNARKGSGFSSQYRGVGWKKTHNCYVARITKDGKTKSLGHFSCEIEAAKAYDVAALKLYGKNAATNF